MDIWLLRHMGRVNLPLSNFVTRSLLAHSLFIYLEYGIRWPLTGGELYYVRPITSYLAIVAKRFRNQGRQGV